MSRLVVLVLRLLGLLALALVLSAAWLFRHELVRIVRPAVRNLLEAADPASGRPDPRAGARAHDKIDSLNAWRADSVRLTASEAASLIEAAIPRETRRHLDSLRVVLGDATLTLEGRVERTVFRKQNLGPLADLLDPWERVTLSGRLVDAGPGRAAWRVQAVTLRGLTFPERLSRRLLADLLHGSGGDVPFGLPPGVAHLRVRPDGVILYRETRT
ncbi:MAG TPA: hypothetical protein VNJ71_14555 [Gemmatimonadales bacterium]|jgi:hypothetical protein|nr:hypothetical protein [Gemmatimonadales bacterium]